MHGFPCFPHPAAGAAPAARIFIFLAFNCLCGGGKIIAIVADIVKGSAANNSACCMHPNATVRSSKCVRFCVLS